MSSHKYEGFLNTEFDTISKEFNDVLNIKYCNPLLTE